jgi:signal transduction histidine kinase
MVKSSEPRTRSSGFLAIRLSLWLLLILGLAFMGLTVFLRNSLLEVLSGEGRQFALEVASRFASRFGLIVAFIACIGALSIWLVIGRPIKALSDAARRMATGDLGARVNPDDMIDDLNTLGESFNEMAGKTQGLVAELRDLNLALESKVRERTADLEGAMSDLQSTQSQLVEAERNAAFGQLTTVLSHELNTPFGAIASATASIAQFASSELDKTIRLLCERGEEDRALYFRLVGTFAREFRVEHASDARERRGALREALRRLAGDRARELEQLLYGSGLAPDDPVLEELALRPVDAQLIEAARLHASTIGLSEVVAISTDRAAGVMKKMRGYLGHLDSDQGGPSGIEGGLERALRMFSAEPRKGLAIERDFAGLLPDDCPADLQQVWINLVENALQSMSYSGTLSLKTARRGDEIRVYVIDTGPGVPEAIANRIFEPFFTTKTTGEGLGLGLDISRRLVERAGGSISFESRPGRTEFLVRLPAISPRRPGAPASESAR